MSNATKTTNSRRHIQQAVKLLVLAVLGFFSLFVGVEDLPLSSIGSFTAEQMHLLIISRLPRLLSIFIAGASLSISGLIMQTVTQNSFVSASTAGTMEWAKLGIVFVMLIIPHAGTLPKIGVAFLFALAGSFLFMFILSKLPKTNIVIVPLMGIMMGNVVGSITTFFAYQFDLVQNVTSWLQGSFSLIIKGSYEFLYLGIPLIIVAYFFANHFTIAGMGENMAQNLGINHARIVQIGLVIVSLISSITIVTVGNIPFIGLIIPNIVRIRSGNSVRHTLFDTAYFGALFVLVGDVLGRLIIFPHEVSIGVVLSVIGSAIFLFILLRRNRHAAANG